MPGYRSLAAHITGDAADLVREAADKQSEGDLATAAKLLEDAIALSVGPDGTESFSGWVCGRLAAIYRSMQRYDDEVALLKRYCELSVTDEAKTRFIARLSKARAIADRAQRRDSGALRTVKEVKTRLKASSRAATGGIKPRTTGLGLSLLSARAVSDH